MKLKNLLIGGSVGVAFFGLYLNSSLPTNAATKTITISNNAFSTDISIANAGDTVVWLNNDTVAHRLDILSATDSSLIVGDMLSPKVSTSTAGRTLSRKFNTEGNFVYRLDATISGYLTIFPSFVTPTPFATPTVTATATPTSTASASPTATATATPVVTASPVITATPSASPTVVPTATASPTIAPTESPTATPTASPTITPTMTATPTPVPTVTPTVAPTVTASPSATPTASPTVVPTITPTIVPTATATASPTVVPTVTASATPTAVPTVSPTVVPTATPVITATPVPTVSPSPTPAGEVLPLFSVFRRTACTATLINNNTQVRTDKLDAVTLLRGTWNVQNFVNTPPNVSLQVQLVSVRNVNLLFGSNPFFGLDRTVAASKNATFTAASANGVLQKASEAWCAQ